MFEKDVEEELKIAYLETAILLNFLYFLQSNEELRSFDNLQKVAFYAQSGKLQFLQVTSFFSIRLESVISFFSRFSGLLGSAVPNFWKN